MAWTKTFTDLEPMRLNKWLAQEGVCSRREAETLIARGQIFINGAMVAEPGRKLSRGEVVSLGEAATDRLGAQITAIVHKPVGYVSAQPEDAQVPAARLVTKANLHGDADVVPSSRTSFAPLGRLDQDSRGLLLLSEDGVLAKAVIGPESQLEKEYLVRVTGEVNEAKVKKLRHGLSLDGRRLKKAKITGAGPNVLRFVLREGRNRQIRRMCMLVDLEVTDLIRVRIGSLKLGDLPEGKWRPLLPGEREQMIEDARPRMQPADVARRSKPRPSPKPAERAEEKKPSRPPARKPSQPPSRGSSKPGSGNRKPRPTRPGGPSSRGSGPRPKR